MIQDPEDEAFNEIERQAQQRKEAVKAALNPYRDQIIEEVAQHIEKMTGFGQDTVDSFAIYIRGMK
jgi:CHASE3 domain sensor protein